MSFLECISTALLSIRQNKVRSLLTTLGVIIGVMSVILLISFGEAAQAYVENEFAGMGSNILIVTPGKQETTGMFPVVAGAFHKLTFENAKEIKRKVPGLRGVAPFVFGTGHVQYGDRRRDTSVIGVTPDFEEVRQIFTQIGRFINQRDIDKNNRVCILGTKVKQELFGSENALNKRVAINRSKHMVVGILKPKGMSLGLNLDDIVLIPLLSAQQMFKGGEDDLFEILISTRSKEDIPVATEQIRDILYAAHDYQEDFTITDQDGLLGTFSKIFDMLRMMLVGIACISLLVGGIGIMNIMLVSVRERTREVGIRKAVGAKRRDIGTQFLIESVTLSVIGGLAGVGLGWAITIGLQIFYPSLPIGLSAWSVLMAFGFSVTIGVFFGVYPALKAASVDPVEALRYE